VDDVDGEPLVLPAKPSMARLTFGRLSEAWKGEAADFTPLLAEQLDALGDAIGVELGSIGETEVPTTGGRRIDIVTQVEGGGAFVVENQYGTADHDHLTRGLAYAVAAEAKGLIVVAERHRDEFRAVARYLNDLAEHAPGQGVSVWLVEATAVRIESSKWAPLFTAVVQPNQFTASVERARQVNGLRSAAEKLVSRWVQAGYRRRLGPNHVVLEAKGPSVGGVRTVIAVFPDGHVMVPFGSYAGQNSGIPVPALTSPQFRTSADRLFGFSGTEKQARTPAGWLTEETWRHTFDFCRQVAEAYAAAPMPQESALDA
jgi:hypothetical protein